MSERKAGNLPGYETTFITRTDASEEAVEALSKKIAQIVTSGFEGENVLTENWGRKKLAYPIEKETRGNYHYVVYQGKPGVVAEIERNLRLSDHVLRYLSINLEKEFDPVSFKKRRTEAQAAAKRREEEREARREERRAQAGFKSGGGSSEGRKTLTTATINRDGGQSDSQS